MAITAARRAGKEIMRYYRQKVDVNYKQDDSPLTLADQKAHQVIVSYLEGSNLIVVSEEGENLHLDATRYWLVDPLDGTKDFLAENDDFTVNIALIELGRVVLGVVYAPATDDLYCGGHCMGAELQRNGVTKSLKPRPQSSLCRMAISRFHDHPDVEEFATLNGIGHRLAAGSALKYCMLATADVDVFPRLVGSSEWDTAAGQAVLEASGGQVLDWHTREPLRYGKPKRRNPRLLAFRANYCSDDFKMKKYRKELL